MAECGGLENRYGVIPHRGFESHALRKWLCATISDADRWGERLM